MEMLFYVLLILFVLTFVVFVTTVMFTSREIIKLIDLVRREINKPDMYY